jgi:hypothetical protein
MTPQLRTTKTTSVAVLVALGFTLATRAAAQPKTEPASDLVALAGQPVDLSPWAYAWRADREVQEKPEASFIPRRLKRLDTVYRTVAIQAESQMTEQERSKPDNRHLLGFLPAPKGGLQSALLWLAPVPTERIELRWSEGNAVPPAEAIEVRVYPSGNMGWFGWVRDEVLRAPTVSADGRTLTYSNQQAEGNSKGKPIFAATDMVAVFLDPAKASAGAKYGCPTIHLFPPNRKWTALDVEIEWGFKEGAEQAVFDGRIEAYDCYVTSVKPLPEDKGTTMTAADAWKSAPAAGGGRRGIVVSLLHPGLFGTGPRSEKPSISPLDARITLWTKGGNLTFVPDHVSAGPILVPEHGVFIAKAGSEKTGRAFAAELAAKHPKSILEVVRRHKETASCEEVLRQIKLPSCKEGTEIGPVESFEEPPETAMRVQTPDERWNDVWRRASWQLRMQKGGWQGISFENAPMIHAADLIGSHDASAKRFEYWLKCPGTTKPDGDFVDGDGSFEYATSMKNDIGYSHDGTHTGTFLLLSAMADRYLLTGDKVWFEQNRARIQRAADWLIRQRRDYLKEVPNRDRLWTAGLLPPMVLSDLGLGRSRWLWYICLDAMSVKALDRWAQALEDFDPAAAKRYREEAEAYRQDLVRVVEREMALSPVRLTRDGTYRTYIPQTPYRRGSMQREGLAAYGVADDGLGSLPVFQGIGVLPADDPRLSGHLEIVEEALLTYSPSRGLAKARKQKGLAEEDDVYFNGIVSLPKASFVAQTHFRRDDLGPFLRYWMNNYAAFVQPHGGMTEGASLGTYQGNPNDKPVGDLGTTAWFMTNFRNLLVWEDGDVLWLARATPRAWLEQGKKISVKNAPTFFGPTAYEIVSDVDNGKINATVELPSRKAPKEVVLRFRHPKSAPIQSVTVNGKPWTEFNKDKEAITLEGLTGQVAVTAQY